MLVPSGSLGQVQVPELERREHFSGMRGSLVEALEELAKVYHLPLVAVFAEPTQLFERPGGMMTAREVLNSLVGENPEYAWEVRDSVVYFYPLGLQNDPNYFLNWKIKRFVISDTVADVELRLRAHLNKIRKGIEGEGGLIVGLRSGTLSNHRLPTLVLRNNTAADILFKAASLDRGFYSLLFLPKLKPITDEELDKALSTWQWAPLEKEEK